MSRSTLTVVLSGLVAFAVSAPAKGQLTLTPTIAPSTPQAVTLLYNPDDGNLSFDTGGEFLTTLEIQSKGGLFDITNATQGGFCDLNGLIENCHNSKGFRIDIAGFESMDIGPIYPLGMSPADVVFDIEMQGSFLTDAKELNAFVDSSPHLFLVPEPSGIVLLSIGALLAVRRRTRTDAL